MKLVLILLSLTFMCANVYAINSGACSGLVYGSGWWRKYPDLGIGEAGLNKMTKASSQGSSLVGTTKWSSQATTAALDPGVSTKASVSSSQVTSSWGPCSLFASAEELKQLRELYYVQNKDEFLKELAQGNGEHLKVMAFFSRCQEDKQQDFNRIMQSKFPGLMEEVNDDKRFLDKFDLYLASDMKCGLRS